MARKRTVEAPAAVGMTLVDKLACVAWEACRAWDACNGMATPEWTEMGPRDRDAMNAAVEGLLADPPRQPLVFVTSPADSWETAVKEKIIAGVVRSIAFV